MNLRVLTVRPLRGEHVVEVEHTFTTGSWFWKRDHVETERYLTPDGVMWRTYKFWDEDNPGRARHDRVEPHLEDLLWQALSAFKEKS